MISGATLLDYRKRYSTRIFFKKRFSRVVVPFLLWSAIYLIYNSMIFHQIRITSFRDIIAAFSSNRILSIFYFFYALIGIYLIVPILSIITQEKYKNIAVYAAIIIFFGTTILRDFNLFSGFAVTSSFQIPLATDYMEFFILGWLLSHTSFNNVQKRLIYILGIIGAISMFVITCVLSLKANKLNNAVMSYVSISNSLMSVAVFEFFKDRKFKKFRNSICQYFVQRLSEASLGIYFIQMIFFPVLWKFFNTYSIRYMLLVPIPLYALCAFIVLLGKRVPVIKELFP
jgi:surface polysaccharide O-acyltransferase-like enzyme